jgi:hypothetical protein
MTGVRGFCEKSLSQFDAQADVFTRTGVKMGRLEKNRAVVRLEVIFLFEITFEKSLKESGFDVTIYETVSSSQIWVESL